MVFYYITYYIIFFVLTTSLFAYPMHLRRFLSPTHLLIKQARFFHTKKLSPRDVQTTAMYAALYPEDLLDNVAERCVRGTTSDQDQMAQPCERRILREAYSELINQHRGLSKFTEPEQASTLLSKLIKRRFNQCIRNGAFPAQEYKSFTSPDRAETVLVRLIYLAKKSLMLYSELSSTISAPQATDNKDHDIWTELVAKVDLDLAKPHVFMKEYKKISPLFRNTLSDSKN